MSQSEITPIYFFGERQYRLKNVGLQNKVSVQISKFGLKYFGNVKRLSIGQKNLSLNLEKFGLENKSQNQSR